MKIFSKEQIREADQATIEQEPISSVRLMERAAIACVDWLIERYKNDICFKIICGTGNNGGDGLAIGRLLVEKGFIAEFFIINHSKTRSDDFSINYEILKTIVNENLRIFEISSIEEFKPNLNNPGKNVFIDALFGSGLNKPVDGLAKEIIGAVNDLCGEIVSIDLPSGLYCDTVNEADDAIIHASHTLTFQFPKLSFMFPENAGYVGEFTALDICLNDDYIRETVTPYYFITKNDVAGFLKKRNKASHKGNFGHALLIAGSYGKMGASVLSGRSCLRAGVGLLTMHVPGCGYEIAQISVPEAMVDIDAETALISDNIATDKYNAIGIGPGMGIEVKTQQTVKLLIQNSQVPVVFDADAINIIAENKTWLAFVRPGSIFTPHVKEFERLAGKSKDSGERLRMQREFSVKNSVYVVLKGSHTSISSPDGTIFFNSTGNPGMATGGSGDVLTGIITSLLAQGYTSQQACILAVYIHGLAGDYAAHEKSEEGMIASDIIESLPHAFHFLRS